MKNEDYLFADELEKFPVSTSWLSRLYGKIPWHFSKKGKIAYLESQFAAIERGAIKYIMQGVNSRHIHEMTDWKLADVKTTFLGYFSRLRCYEKEYRELTGEKGQLSSLNYHQAKNLADSGHVVIDRERYQRWKARQTKRLEGRID